MRIRAALCAGLIAAAVALSLAACGGSSSSSSTSADGSNYNPATDTAAAAGALPSVSDPAAAAPQTAYDWYTTPPTSTDVAGLQSANNTLITDTQQAISTGDASALPGDCSTVRAAMSTLQGDFPSPDSVVNADFARGFALYSSGLNECVKGNFAHVGADLIAGNKWVGKATARISAQKP